MSEDDKKYVLTSACSKKYQAPGFLWKDVAQYHPIRGLVASTSVLRSKPHEIHYNSEYYSDHIPALIGTTSLSWNSLQKHPVVCSSQLKNLLHVAHLPQLSDAIIIQEGSRPPPIRCNLLDCSPVLFAVHYSRFGSSSASCG